MLLRDIAGLVHGEIEGNENAEITGPAKIEEAGPGDITFLANPKYKKFLVSTRASAVLISNETDTHDIDPRPHTVSFIKVAHPYSAFLTVLDIFSPPLTPQPKGIHPTAVIAHNATIHPDASIGAYVIIGERSTVGHGTTILHHTVIGNNVSVGSDGLIYPLVSIREGSTIGDRVIIHSGAVIGSDGFGFAPRENGSYEKIPQRGIVTIGNDVEIGANCTIDRATLGETRIEDGVKLDNLVQIAHNVVVGAHTVIAAQSGISGSTKLGEQCIVGGQVGFVGHITIAAKTSVAAKAGVTKSVKEPGKALYGHPANDIRKVFRVEAALRQLPDLLIELRKLQERIALLERELDKSRQRT
jgi:UDP-3-O-[3-hydroxymyristoyl] glucosamine N-acyltransferase